MDSPTLAPCFSNTATRLHLCTRPVRGSCFWLLAEIGCARGMPITCRPQRPGKGAGIDPRRSDLDSMFSSRGWSAAAHRWQNALISELALLAGHRPVGCGKSGHFVAAAKRFESCGSPSVSPLPCGSVDPANVATDDRRAALNPGVNASIPRERLEPSGCTHSCRLVCSSCPAGPSAHYCSAQAPCQIRRKTGGHWQNVPGRSAWPKARCLAPVLLREPYEVGRGGCTPAFFGRS